MGDNNLNNLNIFNKYDRFTKKPWFFQRDDEILYLYRNFLFNERLNDKLCLDYDIDENTSMDEVFNIYSNIPKKIKFFKIWKNRKTIHNFIIYQQSIKGKTFVERKILKESKSDVNYLYEKSQNNLFLTLSTGLIFLIRTKLTFIFVSLMYFVNSNKNYLGNFLFMINSNEFLMKYQISTKYKLGQETIDFINYINSNLDENSIQFENKNKQYYNKFFVKDIYDLKFEPDDELYNYFAARPNYDFHQEYLKKLESQAKYKTRH